MKNRVWIGNGHVVLKGQIRDNGSVLIEDGRIAGLDVPCPQDAERADARGGYVLPGFIDIHVHGGGDSDFMDATPEDLRNMTRTHCRFGTTSIVPTTMSCDDALLYKAIDNYLACGSTPENGAQILGLHLEGPFFSSAGRGAQPIGSERIPTRAYLENVLERAQGHILRWDAAPELPEMEMFARVMNRAGVLPAIAHTAANATRTRQAFDWGFRHVTHFYNATSTFHKENGIVHAGVIEATYLADDVTIELIGDGRHIPNESMRLAHRIKGADNIALITDAMRAAGTDAVRSILGPREGGTEVIVKDEVAQLPDLSSYAGSVCTMDRALRTAHVSYQLPLTDVSRMLSLTPARLCGADRRKGSIEAGKDADIVIMNEQFEVERVYVMGKLCYKR